MKTSSPENVFVVRSGDVISVSNILLTISEGGARKIMLVGKRYIDATLRNFFYNKTVHDTVFGMKSVSKLGEEDI